MAVAKGEAGMALRRRLSLRQGPQRPNALWRRGEAPRFAPPGGRPGSGLRGALPVPLPQPQHRMTERGPVARACSAPSGRWRVSSAPPFRGRRRPGACPECGGAGPTRRAAAANGGSRLGPRRRRRPDRRSSGWSGACRSGRAAHPRARLRRRGSPYPWRRARVRWAPPRPRRGTRAAASGRRARAPPPPRGDPAAEACVEAPSRAKRSSP